MRRGSSRQTGQAAMLILRRMPATHWHIELAGRGEKAATFRKDSAFRTNLSSKLSAA